MVDQQKWYEGMGKPEKIEVTPLRIPGGTPFYEVRITFSRWLHPGGTFAVTTMAARELWRYASKVWGNE